jgi:hypothetical protein
LLLFIDTLDSQETVAWVLVDHKTGWQSVNCFCSLILAKVINGLLFATAQGNVLGIQEVGYPF